MMVTVGGYDLFSSGTWAEAATQTWGALSAGTWMDILNPHDYEILMGTFSIEDTIEARSTCSFEIDDPAAAYSFRRGMEVTVKDSTTGEVIFGGVVESAISRVLPGGAGYLQHEVTCADNHYFADKRIVAKTFSNKTAGEMVEEILADILAAEGITEGEIQAGPTWDAKIFDYVPASEALDDLAEKANFIWWIDCDKRLYFVDRATYSASWTLTSTDALIEGLEFESGNPEYRNRQYIKGGQEETDSQTENFVGDGARRTFTVGFPVGLEPTITLNAGAQTVGIAGVDTGKDWYWSKNSNVITQDAGGSVLADTDALQVVYIGLYDVMAVSTDYGAVASLRADEGGSGIVEAVRTDALVSTKELAIDAANAALDHYAEVGHKLRYSTIRTGVDVGQMQEITIAELGISGEDYLVVNKTTREEDGLVWYDIEAVSGPIEDGWEKFFAKLSAQARAQIIRESVSEVSVLVVLESFSKTWLETDDPNIFQEVYSDGVTLPGTDYWPCFDDDDKLSYCVLYTGGVEFFRKQVTSQTITASEITTTVFLLSGEANDTAISHVALWGGDACTSTPGSGLELSKHAYVKTKTSLEALQLEFTDTKWS